MPGEDIELFVVGLHPANEELFEVFVVDERGEARRGPFEGAEADGFGVFCARELLAPRSQDFGRAERESLRVRDAPFAASEEGAPVFGLDLESRELHLGKGLDDCFWMLVGIEPLQRPELCRHALISEERSFNLRRDELELDQRGPALDVGEERARDSRALDAKGAQSRKRGEQREALSINVDLSKGERFELTSRLERLSSFVTEASTNDLERTEQGEEESLWTPTLSYPELRFLLRGVRFSRCA